MKRPNRPKRLTKPGASLGDAHSIDVRYGLEPVIEIGSSADESGARGGVHFHSVRCPYCGEGFETQLDTSSGSARYIEDCQICCRPIEFSLEVDHDGMLRSFAALRSD